MKLRRLTQEGIALFTAYLGLLKTEPTTPSPTHLLEEEGASEAIPEEIQVDSTPFATRFDAAKYLCDRLANILDVERDTGLWAWLTLYYLDQLLPARKGKDWPGEMARLVPEVNAAFRYYRHLLLGPFVIYKAHISDPDRAFGILATSPSAPGEVVAQFAGTGQAFGGYGHA